MVLVGQSVSVNFFYHPASGWTQCSCANATLGQTTCCTAGNSVKCNTPFYLYSEAQVLRALRPAVAQAGKFDAAFKRRETRRSKG